MDNDNEESDVYLLVYRRKLGGVEVELLLLRPNMGVLLIREDDRRNEDNDLKYIHRYLLPISLKLGSGG